MSAHTPAPWNVSPPCELSPRYSVYHNGPLLYCDRGEDARLIAAAPDLLSALQALVGEADLGEVDLDEDDRALLDNARDAIAKATGEPA